MNKMAGYIFVVILGVVISSVGLAQSNVGSVIEEVIQPQWAGISEMIKKGVSTDMVINQSSTLVEECERYFGNPMVDLRSYGMDPKTVARGLAYCAMAAYRAMYLQKGIIWTKEAWKLDPELAKKDNQLGQRLISEMDAALSVPTGYVQISVEKGGPMIKLEPEGLSQWSWRKKRLLELQQARLADLIQQGRASNVVLQLPIGVYKVVVSRIDEDSGSMDQDTPTFIVRGKNAHKVPQVTVGVDLKHPENKGIIRVGEIDATLVRPVPVDVIKPDTLNMQEPPVWRDFSKIPSPIRAARKITFWSGIGAVALGVVFVGLEAYYHERFYSASQGKFQDKFSDAASAMRAAWIVSLSSGVALLGTSGILYIREKMDEREMFERYLNNRNAWDRTGGDQ